MPVVNAPPGRNVTSGAISALIPGSTAPCLTSSKLSAETAAADSTGTRTRSVGRLRDTSASTPTSAPRPAEIGTSPGVGRSTRHRPTVMKA
jgi:hypothetical protein